MHPGARLLVRTEFYSHHHWLHVGRHSRARPRHRHMDRRLGGCTGHLWLRLLIITSSVTISDGITDHLCKVVIRPHLLVSGEDGLYLLKGVSDRPPGLRLPNSLCVCGSVLGLMLGAGRPHRLGLLPLKPGVSRVPAHRERGGRLPGVRARGHG